MFLIVPSSLRAFTGMDCYWVLPLTLSGNPAFSHINYLTAEEVGQEFGGN
jgi:hypothetical protein